MEPDFVADIMDVFEGLWYVLWLGAKSHCLWPDTYVGDLELKSSLDTLVDSFPDSQRAHVLLGEFILHLLEPELHGIVHDLNGTPLHNT